MFVKTYNITDDKDVTLTAYIADISEEIKSMKIRPAVLIIPGGSYRFCSYGEAEPVALAYLAEGLNAFTLRYSLNEKAAFPTPLNDAKAALKFMRENAEEFHIDPDKIAVCGFSAGGHLAAALATMPEEKPNACILGYPCILSSIGPTLAKPIDSITDYVTDKTPPTFIFAAANDKRVPIEHSLLYAEALSKNGVNFELHIFSDGSHGFSLGTETVIGSPELAEKCKPNSYWHHRSVEWLRKVF